jgi:hypothetical protein
MVWVWVFSGERAPAGAGGHEGVSPKQQSVVHKGWKFSPTRGPVLR